MKKENIVKSKIRSGQASLGGWCLSGSVAMAEIMAMSGFDWVCVDMEHSVTTTETLINLIIGIENKGADPFVRLAVNEEKEFKKALDAGATGVVVPMVKSKHDVERAVSYAKYSPIGSRSFALPRATGYGKYSDIYFKKANDLTLLAIMIEHIDAVNDLDKILSNQYVDTIFIGPYDLSGSMGIPGDFGNQDFKKVMNEIKAKAKKYQIALGLHELTPTRVKIQDYIKDGFQFIACSMDTNLVSSAIEEFL